MIIPKNIIEHWKPLMTRGDQKEMAKGDENLRKTINAALNGGECTPETFIIIRDFYNARIELLNTALPDDKRIDNIKSNAVAAAGGVLH